MLTQLKDGWGPERTGATVWGCSQERVLLREEKGIKSKKPGKSEAQQPSLLHVVETNSGARRGGTCL